MGRQTVHADFCMLVIITTHTLWADYLMLAHLSMVLDEYCARTKILHVNEKPLISCKFV